MQIISKANGTKIKLDKAEGRRLRDAAYIAQRIARNISGQNEAPATTPEKIFEAAGTMLALANIYCPAVETLNREEAELVKK